jgi:hypothetical protein
MYNDIEWQTIRDSSSVNSQFTPLEIKAFYVVGLLLEICASVDCLLKANSISKNEHPLAHQVYNAGGRYLPAFGVFSSGIELLGRCLTGNETADVNENLRVGFYYIGTPNHTPLLHHIPMTEPVISATNRSYTVQDLIDLRNYAAHGQSVVGEKDPSGKRVPKNSLPGIERQLFVPLPQKLGDATDTYWARLQNNQEHCERLAKARIDPYRNRIDPLQHVISYFSQIPYPSAGSLFSRFQW